MSVREAPEARSKPEAIEAEPGSASGKSSRLFLVDDHCLLREGLRSLIARQNDLTVVGEASTGRVAFQNIELLLPDLVIMDISLEGWSGTQTTERIKEKLPAVKVLAFTIHEDRSRLQEMFQAGASGYLLKSSPADELLKAIRTTLKGGAYVDPGLGENLLSLLCKQKELPARKTALSEREHMVLKQVAQGYANKEIAAHLSISIKTVETLKTRAMNKLSLDSRVGLIHYAMAQGWLTE